MLLSIRFGEVVRETCFQRLIFYSALTDHAALFIVVLMRILDCHSGGLDCWESEEFEVEIKLFGNILYIVPRSLVAYKFECYSRSFQMILLFQLKRKIIFTQTFALDTSCRVFKNISKPMLDEIDLIVEGQISGFQKIHSIHTN